MQNYDWNHPLPFGDHQWVKKSEAVQRLDDLQTAIRNALNELGIPGPDYPAPVTNAVAILRKALES